MAYRPVPLRPGCTAATLILFIAVLLAAPASAAATYSQGSPDFTASITGTNEFVPGSETTLDVLVQNNGVNLFKQVKGAATIAQEDLPNAAKYVTIGLSSSSPLVTVKSDPQFAGTIPGSGGSVLKGFVVKVAEDATGGSYTLPLFISYRYPLVTPQEGSDTFSFVYGTENITIPLTIRMKQGIKTVIVAAAYDNIGIGSEGTVLFTVRNDGQDDGTDAVVTATRNGKSPVIPVDSSVYIGDFSAGGTAACRYRLAVADSAEEQTYPVDVSVTYRNSEGSTVTTAPVTIGVPVSGKPVFEVVSPPPQVAAGATTTVTVMYRNTGTHTVSDAIARMTAHDPVTIGDNSAWLGAIGPGEEKAASFIVQADPGAAPGEYTFDSRVRYRDSSGTSLASDTVTVRMDLLPAEKSLAGAVPGNAVILSGIAIIGVPAIALLIYRRRKGSQ